MKKTLFSRTLSLILALTTVFGLFIFSPAASAETSGNWDYEIENGEATITGYDGSGGDVAIPSEIGGYPVTNIRGYAFQGCTSLTSVTIPNSVTSIGYGAFLDCRSLSSVTIPDSVTNIGDCAFSMCTSLTSVTVPDSVTSIGESAFVPCSSLVSISVSDDNFYYKSIDGVLYDKEVTELICCPGGKTDVDIPDSVTNIGSSAFSCCYSLTSVTIGNGVTSIGEYTFVHCNSLTNLTIPDSVTSIGYGAFEECTSLTSVTIPDSVTSIGDYAFAVCSSLTSVTIPDSVMSIGEDAFGGCRSLTSVAIPDSVTNIGYGAFSGCTGLTSVTIPDSVTSIGEYAFGYDYIYGYGDKKIEGYLIYGFENTEAERYANDNSIDFVSLGEPGVHVYTDVVTAPTCTEQGYTTHTCSRCGDSYVDTYVDALGHDFGADGNAEKCSRCGEKNPDYKPPVNFKDVKPGAYYADAVAWAVAKGVTTGTSATTFSPNAGCTRGQVVAFLWRAAGSPEPKGNKNPFSDVKSNAYYYKAVLWAVENEVTSGTDATHFSPNSVCTRGQIVTFLWRANGKPAPAKTANPFKDVKASDYYYDAVLWAVEKDITLGTDAAHFSPSSTCTRGQVVAFLYRAME